MTDATPSPPRRLRRTAGRLGGAVPGAVLGAAFGAVARARRTKPLHPAGRVGTGVLDVTDPVPELGVPLLATARQHGCTVRWSRSMGLPRPLPDIEGFAIRFDEPVADVLFASTGTGSLTRFVLLPRRPGTHGPQSTLIPVATGGGSLLLKVDPLDGADPPNRYDLSVARAGSAWRSVGTLEVQWGVDRPTRFDPVENLLPGTSQYALVRALREPAYLMARRGADAKV